MYRHRACGLASPAVFFRTLQKQKRRLAMKVERERDSLQTSLNCLGRFWITCVTKQGSPPATRSGNMGPAPTR
jgi:hypothetical protein